MLSRRPSSVEAAPSLPPPPQSSDPQHVHLPVPGGHPFPFTQTPAAGKPGHARQSTVEQGKSVFWGLDRWGRGGVVVKFVATDTTGVEVTERLTTEFWDFYSQLIESWLN